MSKAKNTSTTSRRGLLAASGVGAMLTSVGLSSPAVATFQPDAELVAIGRAAIPLVEEYQRATATFFAIDIGHPDLERVAELAQAPFDALDLMIDRASELTTATLEGYVAKARLIRHDLVVRCGNGNAFDPADALPGELLMWSLANDLLARSALA